MQNRREFLKNTSLMALGAMSLNSFDLFAKKQKPVGLQLFTFFPSFDNDVSGNLQKIKNIGFQEIESAFSVKGGYYGMKSSEFAKILSDLGLDWKSHHVGGAPFKPNPRFDTSKMPKMLTLKNDTQQIVDELAGTGVKYLVCSSIPIETLDEVKQGTEILNNAAEVAKKAGLQLCYHNHDKEFIAIDGQKPYDIFLKQISPDLLKFELDLAWVSKASVDPVALFKANKGRFPLLHVKDMDKTFENIMPVGEGVIDFKTIFAHAKEGGVKHYFVEHDMPKDAIASITSSFSAMQKLR
jgi:sugar phosphate isomerase/epimerase